LEDKIDYLIQILHDLIPLSICAKPAIKVPQMPRICILILVIIRYLNFIQSLSGEIMKKNAFYAQSGGVTSVINATAAALDS